MYDIALSLKRNTMSYFEEEVKMVQQISDAELEIMKAVWANGEKPTLLNRLINKGFLKAKNRALQ